MHRGVPEHGDGFKVFNELTGLLLVVESLGEDAEGAIKETTHCDEDALVVGELDETHQSLEYGDQFIPVFFG